MLSIHRGLWHSIAGLFPQSPWGTDVFPATPGQWCFLSSLLRDAGHQPGWRPWLALDLSLHPSHWTHQHPNLASSGIIPHLTKAYPTGARRGGSLQLTWGAPHKKQKPLARTLREAQSEAFSKDSEVVKGAQQTYQKTHKAMFDQEGSYDLTSVFWDMAWETGLLNVEICEVQEVWTGWQELKAFNCAIKASQRNIQFFMVMPTESPNIMGLKEIHCPEALCWQGSHSYCPWFGKEGQNEGTVVNHLRNMHYHLGLVCTLCMDFFTASMDTMRWHVHICRSMAAEDRDHKEEEESKNDSQWWGQWLLTWGGLILNSATPTTTVNPSAMSALAP